MNERLNISDLAALLAEYTGKDKKTAESFLRELLVVISDALLEDRIVKVKGLGTFKVVQVEERESVHVNTGERFVIPAHSKFTFTPDKDLREQVNKPFASFETTELNDGVTFPEEKEEELKEEEPEEEEVVDEPVAENVKEPEEENEPEPEEENESEVEPEPEPDEVESREPEKVESPEPEEVKVVVEKPADVPPPHTPKKQNGTFVFLGLFVVACIIGGIYFFNSNSKKINNIKDIKQEQVAVAEPEPILPEESSDIVSDSTLETEPDVVDTSKTEPKKTVIVKIVPDTRLTLIALEHYGHKAFWVYIYEHNKAIINNPNNIQMGTELIVPDPGLYGIDAKNPESVAKAKAKQAEINSLFN